MIYKRLGKSGAVVSKLCLGTMNFGMVTSEQEAFNIMDCALDLGIHFFDTSNSYGGYENRGLTESIIGKWFDKTKKRNSVFLADKVYHLTEPFFNNPNDECGLSAYKIHFQIEESLKRLHTDHIDLYQMHHIDHNVCWDEIWYEFHRLYSLGKIVYTGSSNFSAYDIAKCNSSLNSKYGLGLVSEQHRYNLLCRLPELEVIPACRKENMSFLVWGPLCAGRLGDNPFNDKQGTRASHNQFNEKVKHQIIDYQEFCKKENINPALLSLSWLLSNPDVTSVIVGPRTVEQLKSCVDALSQDNSQYFDVLNEMFTGPGGEAPEAYAW